MNQQFKKKLQIRNAKKWGKPILGRSTFSRLPTCSARWRNFGTVLYAPLEAVINGVGIG